MSVEDFLRLHVPIAEPCWDQEEQEEEKEDKIVSDVPILESQKNVGTGMSYIQYLVQCKDKSIISNGAQNILQDLLSKHKEELKSKEKGEDEYHSNNDSHNVNNVSMWTNIFANAPPCHMENDEFLWNEYDCELIETKKLTESAKQGKVSLLCTILRLFHKDDDDDDTKKTPISTKSILSTCTMSMRPADIPPDMTSRQMVLSALHFLVTSIPSLSSSSRATTKTKAQAKDIFPFMPILSFAPSDNDSDDIETRSFVKNTTSGNGDWSVKDNGDFRRKVLLLEKAFFASTLQHTSRIHMCPRSHDKSKELSLICRGYTSKATAGDKKASSSGKKRKASDASSSPKSSCPKK